MKTVTLIAIVLILLLLAAGIQITFKPFTIKFRDLFYAVGLLFIILSIPCFQVSAHKQGVRDGYKEATRDVKRIVDSLKQKQINEVYSKTEEVR